MKENIITRGFAPYQQHVWKEYRGQIKQCQLFHYNTNLEHN